MHKKEYIKKMLNEMDNLKVKKQEELNNMTMAREDYYTRCVDYRKQLSQYKIEITLHVQHIEDIKKKLHDV